MLQAEVPICLSCYGDLPSIDLTNMDTASAIRSPKCGPLQQWEPDLYMIATRKERSAAKETIDNKWIRFVARLSTPVLSCSFPVLGDMGHCPCPSAPTIAVRLHFLDSDR
jgi:hypothetical protein